MPIGIDAGTASRRSRRAGAFDVTEVRFSGGERLRWHAHPRACVAVVVSGAVRKRFAGSCADAREATLVAMPAEEPHEDVFGADGAAIVVVEPEADVVGAVRSLQDWHALTLAHRIASELTVDDAFSPLALEGLALELTAAAGRGAAGARPERWLQHAYELLHERFRELPSASEIAACVGVHPSHLARRFRACYGESLGGCVRRLRLDWAASQLVQSDVSIACLAVGAGFVDQSHFTRAFRARFGITPARYRAAHR